MKFDIIRTLAPAAFLMAAAFAVSCNSGKKADTAAAQPAKLTNVTIKAVAAKDVDQVEVFTGTVEGFNTNNISPQSPGSYQPYCGKAPDGEQQARVREDQAAF